jgi:hypothetical protein
MSGRPLANEGAIWEEIRTVMQKASEDHSGSDLKVQIDSCVRDLGLICARHTARLYEIRLRHQVRTLHPVDPNAGPVSRQTSAIKASNRRLDPPRNPIFSRDNVS